MFATYIDKVLSDEGGYSNDPNDPGGETNFGITKAVAEAHGYTGQMIDMNRDQAVSIYESVYWNGGGCNLISPIFDELAGDLFELGVNTGSGTAGRFLQQAINYVCFGACSPITIDGQIGAGTANALQKIINYRGQDGAHVVRGVFLSLACVHYLQIAQNNPNMSEYEFGWQRARIIGAP